MTLFDAVRTNDISQLSLLLEEGVSINQEDSGYYTPLTYAVAAGRTEMVRVLLRKGADPRVGVPIIEVCVYERLDIIPMLVARGADIDAVDNCGYTALSRACSRKDREMVELLLSIGADPNIGNMTHPLTYEIMFNKDTDGSMLGLLVDGGYRIDSTDVRGMTLLMYSSMYPRERIVSLLLDKGANPNVKGSGGRTPLMIASSYGHVGIVRILLDGGSDSSIGNDSGSTAYDMARSQEVRDVLSPKD